MKSFRIGQIVRHVASSSREYEIIDMLYDAIIIKDCLLNKKYVTIPKNLIIVKDIKPKLKQFKLL